MTWSEAQLRNADEGTTIFYRYLSAVTGIPLLWFLLDGNQFLVFSPEKRKKIEHDLVVIQFNLVESTEFQLCIAS